VDKQGYQILEKVQKRATNLIRRLDRLYYVERLKLLTLATSKYRQIHGDMIQVSKIVHLTLTHLALLN